MTSSRRNSFDYDGLVQEALRGVVRKVLQSAAEHGLPGKHHFYIAFRTDHPGVAVPDHLRERYPEEITIVLQHQFWNLKVLKDHFEVALSFNKKAENLVVPFAALTGFMDPSVQFGLQLQSARAVASSETQTPLPEAADDNDAGAPQPAPAAAEGETPDLPEDGNVVALDVFRKKAEP